MRIVLLAFLILNCPLYASMDQGLLQSQLETLVDHLCSTKWGLCKEKNIGTDNNPILQYRFTSEREVPVQEANWSWEAFITPRSTSDACSLYLKYSFSSVAWLVAEVNKRGGNYLYISDVHVDEEYRNKGYATQMLRTVLDWFDFCGVEEVRLRSWGYCHGLYEKVGFKITSRIKEEYGAKELIDMARARKLGIVAGQESITLRDEV